MYNGCFQYCERNPNVTFSSCSLNSLNQRNSTNGGFMTTCNHDDTVASSSASGRLGGLDGGLIGGLAVLAVLVKMVF